MNWTRIWLWLKDASPPAPLELRNFVGRRVKFKAPKDTIKFPKGSKDKRSQRDRLEEDLDNLCRLVYKARDLKDGAGYCISCDRMKMARDLQWGHFVPQGESLWLRWDTRNFAAQCVDCNIFGSGQQARYAIALDKKYNQAGFSAGLILEANRHKTWHPSIKELEDKKLELKQILAEGLS
jgi:hypothetical protein